MNDCSVRLASVSLLLLVFCAACAHGTYRPPAMAFEELEPKVRAVLQNGDWLVIRGLEGGDNVVSAVTSSALSHSAIYDKDKDAAIEAKAKGVRSFPLEDFLRESRRVIIIRPYWRATDEAAAKAVGWARSKIGRPYNFTGLVGLGFPDRYYCTQLVVAAYTHFNGDKPNPVPAVIRPDKLYHWGTIIFDSGP